MLWLLNSINFSWKDYKWCRERRRTAPHISSFSSPRSEFPLDTNHFSRLKLRILFFLSCLAGKSNASSLKRFNLTKFRVGKLSRCKWKLQRYHVPELCHILWQATHTIVLRWNFLILDMYLFCIGKQKLKKHAFRSVCLQRVYEHARMLFYIFFLKVWI